jgi:uncharacterized protein (DUF849 family)
MVQPINQHFSKEGTKPEFEVYDVGMINNLAFLIAREPGVEPATSEEARQILNLKGLDKVRF